MAAGLARVRELGGRLFILGVGGSAGHAGHAVNDFRKLCGFEAYAPTDNVSELTARANDEGWDTCFAAWLEGSRISSTRRRAGVLRGRRQSREKCIGEHRQSAGNRHRRRARTSSASWGATADSRARSPKSCIVIPTARSGAHHAAHRRAVRGALAFAGQPSAAAARSAPNGSPCDDSITPLFFMAGGAGLHRQPFH